MTNDLEIAIQMFRNQAARCRGYERYYKGEHDLSFATEKFQSAFGARVQGVCNEPLPGDRGARTLLSATRVPPA